MTDVLHGLELRSLITAEGQLRISLEPLTLTEPGPGEVIVRIEATPINPSDLGLLIGPADAATLRQAGTADQPLLVADVPAHRLPAVQARVGQSLAVGNEGAGTIVRAGPDLQPLLGRKVAMIGGGMYASHRKLRLDSLILLPETVSAAQGASMFVNPQTALGFVETMRIEGHKAIVHTAAASSLGQMLVRLCKADGIPLVCIVRSAVQAALLRALGASHVIDSSDDNFFAQLVDAIADTGATLGFDAVGGGKLASQILGAMESVASRSLASYSRYGSSVHKQVYIYGTLDSGPTVINRVGYSWQLGGWLLTDFLHKAGPDVAARIRQRIVDEITTTFASHYTATISLSQALDPQIATRYERKETGAKYLIDPSLP
jgi:NADPH:quinone reductase-like Zn-dependent oxidoreductase